MTKDRISKHAGQKSGKPHRTIHNIRGKDKHQKDDPVVECGVKCFCLGPECPGNGWKFCCPNRMSENDDPAKTGCAFWEGKCTLNKPSNHDGSHKCSHGHFFNVNRF